METQINTSQKIVGSVQFMSADGQIVAAPGPVVWSSDSVAVSLSPSDDGLRCIIYGMEPGQSTITVTSGNLSQAGVVVVVADVPPVIEPPPVADPTALSMVLTFSDPEPK